MTNRIYFLLLATVPGIAHSGEISLRVPDPIDALPTIASRRHTVHAPAQWNDLTYHHRPLIAAWRDKLFVVWHAAARSKRTPPVVPMVASSSDGVRWSKPTNIAGRCDARYVAYTRKRHDLPASSPTSANSTPLALHVTDGCLYVLASAWAGCQGKRYWRGRAFFTDDGRQWRAIAPEQLDRLPGLLIRNHWTSRRFTRLRDGKLMAACRGRDGLCAPTTADPTGLTGWSGGHIDVSDRPVRIDPSIWRGPDGVLHYAASHLSRLWHSYSRDGGRTWAKLSEQPGFPDNRGGAAFGTLPDGRVWYLGNPLPDAQRCPLVLAVSRDGWRFDQVFRLRWEPFYREFDAPFKGVRPGYEYPDAIVHDGALYVVYSIARERVELTVVDLTKLPSSQ